MSSSPSGGGWEGVPAQRKCSRDIFDSHFGIGGEVSAVFETAFGVPRDDHSHELAAGDRVPQTCFQQQFFRMADTEPHDEQ